jgi:hypothetical protein
MPAEVSTCQDCPNEVPEGVEVCEECTEENKQAERDEENFLRYYY